jgi:predicted phosphoadenosine phosphosulfate sulfurtransferase
VETWKCRCYFDDIPDEVPAKLQASGRVPSYKAIAIALLSNDLPLKSLGFWPEPSQYYFDLKGVDADDKALF